MKDHVILGLHVTNRTQQVPDVQRTLTAYGKFIRTRLGLHDVHAVGEPAGLIVLEIEGNDADAERLAHDLRAIQGVHVQKMVFQH